MNLTDAICPLCQFRLTTHLKQATCVSGHSFDIAREGYVNLLVGKKLGPHVGDSAEMVQARRAFLETGLYKPLADTLVKFVSRTHPETVADIGCGEGYYLNQILSSSLTGHVEGYGVDISKAAILSACRRDKNASFFVADARAAIPLATHSIDFVLNVFAPKNAAEFARITKPGGSLIVVVPSDRHLKELRERFSLLGIEPDKPSKIATQLTSFRLENTETIAGQLELNSQSLRWLIEMTPNSFHLGDVSRGKIATTDSIVTGFEFIVLEFVRLGR